MARTVLSTKHLYDALAEHRDRPSFSTVKRWVEGKQEMPEWALDEVARLLGITKEAAPSEEGAASELLRLWGGTEPPAWSNVQVGKVIEEIRRDRSEAMAAMARQIGRMTTEELQALLSRLRDGSTQGPSDP